MGQSQSDNNQAQQPECCPPTALPSRSAAQAGASTPVTGEEFLLRDDIRAYVARPKGDIKAAVLVFHDIFGFASSRTHHLCDELADEGFLVLSPDFFGRELDGVMEKDEVFSIWAPWRLFTGGGSTLIKRARIPWTSIEEKMTVALKWLRDNGAEGKAIGALGFCWGGWAITRAASTEHFACVIGAHPAPHVQHFQSDGPSKWELYSMIKCPVLFLPSGDDPAGYFPDGADFLEIKKHSPRSVSIKYSTMIHGWLNRGDIRNPIIKKEVDGAMSEIKSFFGIYLLGNSPIEGAKL